MKVSLTKAGHSVPADLSLMNGKDIRNTDCIREYTPEHIREEYVPQIEVLENNNLPVPTETPTPKKKGIKARLISRLKDILLDPWTLETIAVILICSALFSCLIWFVFDAGKTIENISEQNQIVDEARAGIIVDKEIINARSTIFHDFPPEYRIYINCEYEHDGEAKTVKKYFTVSESIYLAYDVGDYFNSQNY